MHIPVLLQEVIYYLAPQSNENFIDATVGEGGHTKEILQRNGPDGKVLGIEADPELYQQLKKQNLERLILVNDSYTKIEELCQDFHFEKVNGILFDLGLCTWQLEESRRGFSYLKDEPLDMRFNPRSDLTAAEIINFWPREELERIIREYGEERYSKRIVEAILEARRKERIVSTSQLVSILKSVLPANYEHHRLHFAARTFQALRIAVNNELDNLEKGVESGIKVLAPGGRIVVISFHSLEDRIIKNIFKKYQQQQVLKILTKKPVVPLAEEIKQNSHAHSAKLRAALKN